ncbi:MAG: NADH-quinone oxidoreductase subunit I [Chloroflexi bacterium]|nr:NADH-quinone oxidoreductase subunit I [Chloroflexota bacterium]
MPYGLGLLQGLVVTLRNLGRKPFTVQYPEERLPQHPRFRGQEFTWYEERCTGCASCAKFCPLGIIKIVTAPGDHQTQEGEKYSVETFDIELGRCMFCGLCVEACPYDALHMGSSFERGRFTFKDLVIHVDELKRAPKRPSTWFRPQLEHKGYAPLNGPALSWTEVGRRSSDDPGYEEMRQRWIDER